MPAPKGNKNAVGNDGGAPTKYKEEYNEQAYKLCLLGATDKDLADFFEVHVDTINEWKKVYIEFSYSLKRGKQIADATIAESLYHRAKGYEHEDVDIKMYEGNIIETPLIKHYPPDTTAAIFWLKNRQPKEWRDKQDIEAKVETTSTNDALLAIAESINKKANDPG